MIRKASAVWQGDLKSGSGTMTAPSGVMTAAAYTFATRFEEKPGTNPEELIAAAHAGCFSMALSMILGEAGIRPERIDTTATVTLEKADGGFSITKVHLEVNVRAPGADRAKIEAATGKAKIGCPVSKVLNAAITMNASLVA